MNTFLRATTDVGIRTQDEKIRTDCCGIRIDVIAECMAVCKGKQ